MTTRKRLILIAAVYFSITILALSVLALGAKTAFANHELIRLYIFSMLFPPYSIAWGIATRLISCRPCALPFSLVLMTIQIIAMLYGFRFIYDNKSYGIQNLGFSYVVITFVFMLIPFLVCHCIIAMADKIRARKIVMRIAKENRPQLSIETSFLMKVYNKKFNRYEKYLLWNNGNKTKASERVIYYDYVELVAVDSSRRVYALKSPPKKIRAKHGFALLTGTQ